jgi:glutamine synthetase
MIKQLYPLPEGTHTVALGVGDMNGIMRGKRIPASNWPSICKSGSSICIAAFSVDMTCDIWETPYIGMATGYPDMHIFPLSAPVASPWEPGVAICMGYAEGMDHKQVPIDPRGPLVTQVERLAELGYELKLGMELEFYLLDPETLRPRDKGIQVYSLARAAELEHVLGPIRRNLNDIGIPIEQSNPEYAAGQAEVNIRYDEPLLSADRVVMFRSLVKEIAAHHGYLATFMAKPFIDQSGSGFHTHHSLWKDGKNVFSDNGKLSKLGRSYMAGMQKHMCDLTLAGATTPNAYRRYQPYTFCPINDAWGVDNRTCALRIIEGAESAVRIEKRNAAADCNPYYLAACDIAAGIDGMNQEMEPSEESTGNAYESTEARPLPSNLGAALELARESELLKATLGEDRLTILIQQGERELDFVADQVTPVEVERYLGNL